MIEKGSTAVIRTVDSIYSPCKILGLSEKNITIEYYSSDKGELPSSRVETISLSKVLSIAERK